LFDDEHVAVVPPSHPWASRPFVTLAEIASEPLYLFSRSIENSFIVRKVLRPAGLTPSHATHLQLSEGIIEMVKAGMGATGSASRSRPPWRRRTRPSASPRPVFRKRMRSPQRCRFHALHGGIIRLLIKQGPASRRHAPPGDGLVAARGVCVICVICGLRRASA
jgi:DNA-binding transcriptional LysR family regulator